jgi:hypothetical protein
MSLLLSIERHTLVNCIIRLLCRFGKRKWQGSRLEERCIFLTRPIVRQEKGPGTKVVHSTVLGAFFCELQDGQKA